MSFLHYIETSPWVPEDALFQVLKWQNTHVPAEFLIENDNGSEVCSPVNSLRGISEYDSVTHALLSLHVFALYKPEYKFFQFEPKRSIG